jgi:predicted alpha/beta-hydrolase family hydrolase
LSGGDPGTGRRYAERAQFVPLPDGEVSALHVAPPEPVALLVFAHGAGAGMEHPYMSDMAQRLAGRGVATFRYQFPSMERRSREGGRRPPDRPPVLVATVRAAVARARRLADGLPLFAGGKSMGGRMTSTAAAESPLEGVRGIVFFGFPLHPSGRPSTGRADHLAAVDVPTLFVQGTRDTLADLDLLRPIVAGLPRATLLEIEGADHGFHVLKRSGRSDEAVADEVAGSVAGWMSGL